MDKIKKALTKLTSEERKSIKKIIKQIRDNSLSKLDIKKLRGRQDIYRVRKGKIRIIYRIDKDKNIFILAIERRNDNTYNI